MPVGQLMEIWDNKWTNPFNFIFIANSGILLNYHERNICWNKEPNWNIYCAKQKRTTIDSC